MTILRDIEREREARLHLFRNQDLVLDMDSEFNRRMGACEHYEIAKRAWDFANQLEYHHPGLNKSIYLMHPLRVAEMYVSLSGTPVADGTVTALLHNVIEVSGGNANDISIEAGEQVAKAVTLLTVDRALQWDEAYKDAYYQHIYASEVYVRQVKALDKLDNLYLLCLNPSEQVRRDYLREIEKWVIPMVEKDLPEIRTYFYAVYENAVSMGFLKVEN